MVLERWEKDASTAHNFNQSSPSPAKKRAPSPPPPRPLGHLGCLVCLNRATLGACGRRFDGWARRGSHAPLPTVPSLGVSLSSPFVPGRTRRAHHAGVVTQSPTLLVTGLGAFLKPWQTGSFMPRSPPPPAPVAATAADARSDRAVALAMVALSIAAAASYGTPRAIAIAGAWGGTSAVAAVAASTKWYRGPTRAATAAALRVAYSAALELFVASGRRAPVTIASHTGFWASRVGPVVVLLYAVTARLPRRAHRTVAAASALVAAILQPAACTSISACTPASTA